ncbi:LAME_0H05688g1_1 [Lachancea meyersii CBS 8951]|uniref:LAME_0H05688g1_1 n=1 Tax=Lachancea meyersii CBS 8951 TaxID=1266667 RepID=A0A1G4KEL7_9SACH|nr:LAME_0H05688g1_1 [Lachancea meyersii CBS 8951]
MSFNLEHVLGFKVKITNVLDTVTVGRIYSYNSSNNTITLQESRKGPSQSQQFKVIKLSFVKFLEVVGEKPQKNSFKRDPIKPSEVSIESIQEMLQKRIESARSSQS